MLLVLISDVKNVCSFTDHSIFKPDVLKNGLHTNEIVKWVLNIVPLHIIANILNIFTSDAFL